MAAVITIQGRQWKARGRNQASQCKELSTLRRPHAPEQQKPFARSHRYQEGGKHSQCDEQHRAWSWSKREQNAAIDEKRHEAEEACGILCRSAKT
ncbi:hypothetical protein FHR56_002756 [Xanthomonas sacchari]|uniref:hypothetical protein n=1 Tax=unclassified Xanthomonas TaxID=2643310 RepID=UPI0013702CDE|nr:MULTISPECIES: hypothetical protein [unclassified Xanthomonas]MBB6367591.1 hypothetical protein [Xanthomonas sp. F10]